MNRTSSKLQRHCFYDLNNDAVETIKSAKSFILSQFPSLLDLFYDHVAKFDETAQFFRDRAHMDHAKQMQLKHWSFIADGELDDAYIKSVIATAQAHNRLGLTPSLYIGGYSFLISKMLERIIEAYPGSMQKKSKLQSAFVKLALIDVDYVITAYFDENTKSRNTLLQKLASEFEQSFGGVFNVLGSAAEDLQATAKDQAAVINSSITQAEHVAKAAGQASQSVHTVAAAAEQLSTSVQEILGQVTTSNVVSKQALANAEASTIKVHELFEATQKIGDVVNFISSIAKQTNLLALNATIESARAGEVGRGFAVVAQEVKALAEQTTRATADIASQIKAVQDSTTETVKLIGAVSQIIRSLDDISTNVTTAVGQQGLATIEIAQSVSQAAEGTKDVSSHIQDVSNATNKAGASTQRVLAAAENLSRKADQLRTHFLSFLTTLHDATHDDPAHVELARNA